MGTSNHTVVDYSLVWSNRTKDFWKSPRGTVIRIEVLVVVAAIALLFLAVFGSQRRRSRNFLVQKGILGAFTLSSSLVTYTLGSMQSSAVKSSMYPLWAISLYILFGCANSITSYSLDDNDQFMRLLFQCVIYLLYVFLIIITTTSPFGYFLACCLLIIAYLKVAQRLWAGRLASNSFNLSKLVADFMDQEHTNSNGSSYDPATMRGYHYLVDWPLVESKLGAGTSYATVITADAAQVIDIERIWLCNDMSISSDLKDTCLSFSLFHLLRRRFFGFACAESSQPKTHDFFFKGLLSKNEDGVIDYNRVFRLIEVELAFMYDFFFTKYALLYYGSKKASTTMSLVSATLVLILACLSSTPVRKIYFKPQVSLETTTADVIITALLLVCIALLELLQLLLYWTTIWGRVSFVCQYIREQTLDTRGSCCMRFKEILTKTTGVSNKQYYRDRLGQYCLISSILYDPNPSKAMHCLPIRILLKFFQCLNVVTLYPYFDPHNAIDYVAKPGKPIKLPAQVKEALVQFLERSQGILTNGESSLVSNRACHLLWACRQLHLGTSCLQKRENQSHLILTWHIATCYSNVPTDEDSTVGEELNLHLVVAIILSRYCVYLMDSAPKLLPGHHYDTSCVFSEVRKEAGRFLRSAENRYEAMKSLPESTETIFQSGVKLVKQLQEMEKGTRWKVLADFWTELLLYIAPSDNVKEHIQLLANGGEFITHLWALLTHAGILDRGQRNVVDIENALPAPTTRATDQPATHGNSLQRKRSFLAHKYFDKTIGTFIFVLKRNL
ncbi:unnamed protein product [Urochloa decumbens]|uniref:DUF4220 domain-containing protein n=1 Tax=Urochloa decumbens TaxID=240449 RepID=A0ABC8XZP9_9POAL